MELDRAHRRAPSTTSDLFICFSSRLTKSSAMRLSSKSMVSPGRTDHNKPPISLSASLSRKLRTKNGSLRGGQSPMFPPGVSKKRGSAIENNPEPSSPKVTCIGQVRVKTKKHGKKMKSHMKKAYRARRSGSNGGKDVSFRRNEGEGCLQHRNQRWVHLPMTICDALRAFGSELNCFSNCRRPSSCFSRSEVVREKCNSRSSSCGGSVCKWLVALHEGEGKRRDIELVVGEEKEEERGKIERVVMERECSRRRSIFDDMDFNIDEICEEKNEIIEEEAARVSICIPPKNALLLMRCRSDPVKMSALASKFWESPPKKDQGEEEFEGVKDKVVEEIVRRRSSFNETEKIGALLRFVKDEEDQKLPAEKKEERLQSTEPQLEVDSERQQCAESEMYEELIQEEKHQQRRPLIDCKDRDCLGIYEEEQVRNLGIVEVPDEEEKKEATEVEVAQSGQSFAPLESAPSIEHELEQKVGEKEDPIEIQQTAVGEVSEEGIQPPPLEEEREEKHEEEEEEEPVRTQKRSEQTLEKAIEEEEDDDAMEELESGDVMRDKDEEEESPALPECLLLMMCEPKLSMEVSKETWVCSTDFIRRLPERHRQHHLKKINPTNGGGEADKKKKKDRATNTESNPAPRPPPPAAAQKQPPQGFQPARSSCSFPLGGRVSTAAAAGGVKEKKAANYEPIVLKRCKSAPMRSGTAKLAAAPEMACFWKNRKIEPHRPATCGVGAAGVGC